jgi:hypothetical protein
MKQKNTSTENWKFVRRGNEKKKAKKKNLKIKYVAALSLCQISEPRGKSAANMAAIF